MNTQLRAIFVVLLMLGWLTFVPSQGKEPREIRVPQEFPTIQQAVDAAEPGDTIILAEGVYREHVVITKPLTLQPEKVFPDQEEFQYVLLVNPEGDVSRSTVLVCGANDVNLKGLHVTHNAIPPGAAIAIEAGGASTLTGVTLGGIHAFGARDGNVRVGIGTLGENLPPACIFSIPGIVVVTIRDSVLDDSPWAGIYVETMSDSAITVENSAIIGNARGIRTLSGGAILTKLTLIGNTISNNKELAIEHLNVGQLILQDNIITRNGLANAPSNDGLAGVGVSASTALLERNLIWQNNGSGLDLSPHFRNVVSVDLIDNVIRENEGCGVSAFGTGGVVTVGGTNNEISGNKAGDLCPADFAWPPAFQQDRLLTLNASPTSLEVRAGETAVFTLTGTLPPICCDPSIALAVDSLEPQLPSAEFTFEPFNFLGGIAGVQETQLKVKIVEPGTYQITIKGTLAPRGDVVKQTIQLTVK